MSKHESLASALDARSTTSSGLAALGILVLVAGEFGLRRGLTPHLADVVGTSLGADMLTIALGLPIVAGIVVLLGHRGGITHRDWALEFPPQAIGAGIAGFLTYVVVFSGVALIATSLFSVQSPTGVATGGASASPAWALAALVLVNGILVPILEELAWRGVIQTALMDRYGTVIGVVATAVPFVLKHLVVDLAAPPVRVLSLVVLAFALGGLRARYGTGSSTVAHLVANVVFTSLAVLA